MSIFPHHILAAALAGTALAFPVAAFAQDGAAGTAADAPTPPAARSSDTGQIKDIIVTARRRNESIQTTPVAVTAVAPAQLEATAAVKISDLQGLAPNVLITTQSTGAATANISIRGIAFADVDKSFDPAVGVNIDGVYIGTSTGQMLDFFDIASIEILRGPQGTLFGRNTIAGVINVRRTRPTGEWGGKFEATAGSYGQFGLRGVLNVPVVPGVLAAKFFSFHQQDDGFYRAYGTGQHLGGNNQENFGAALLFTPTSNFDALLTLEKQEQRFGSYNGFLGETGDVFCTALPAVQCNRNNTTDIYTVFPGPAKLFGRYSAPAATLEMNWDTGPVKLTSVTSYRKSRERQLEDFGSSNLYLADRFQHYHQFSQELRASGNLFQGFDYVAGLYYFDSRYELVQNTEVFFTPAGTQDTIGKSRSMAAFADFNWEVLPRVRLSGGGRFTHDRKQLDNPLILGPGGISAAGRKSWSRFTPKVSLDYRPTDDLMVYASWSRGYRSGGFSGRGLSYFSATTPYDPETVDSYEIGLKSEFFDRKLAFNVAAFYTDYRNIQQNSTVTLPPPGVGNETIVVNAAGARIKGIEADLTARPIENVTLRGSFGYTHSRFHGFLVNQPVALADGSSVIRSFDFSKVDLIYAPKVTAAINAEYRVPMNRKELRLNAGYRFLSRYDQQIAADPALYPALLADPTSTATVIVPRNDPRLRSDRQNLVDASISMIWDMNDSGAKARVTFFGRNLLDDRGTATSFTVASFPTLWAFTAAREPRVFGAQLGFEF